MVSRSREGRQETIDPASPTVTTRAFPEDLLPKCRIRIATELLEFAESEPRNHAANIKRMLTEVSDHIEKVDDLQAKALFETTREVLNGLTKAVDDYEAGAPAWR